MSHPLQSRLGQIRRRVRTLVVLHAVAWMALGVVSVLMLLGLIDYLIRFEDHGLRMMCSLMVLNVFLWGAIHYLWPAVRARFNDVDLALRVERRFPQLAERLSSTVQFLKAPADDPTAGSAALRREVVVETTALVEPLDLRQVIDTRPVRGIFLASLAVCFAGIIVFCLAPASSRTALRRLLNPLGGPDWPKVNQLMFVKPVQRVALGGRFEVEVADALKPLPREVRMHYRFDGDPPGNERVEPMKLLGHDVMVAGMDDVKRPFSYRAEGGDDDSLPWIPLEVIEPPAVEELKVTLHYPAYSSWPAATSEPHMRALVGTRVELAGKTTKPLNHATLKLDGAEDIPLQLADDGYSFSLSASSEPAFVVKKSGTYSFELEDREGFRGGQAIRYEVRAIEDRPPSVAIEEPSQDSFVTAAAVVPVRMLVKDDLAIKQVHLHLLVESPVKGTVTVVPIFTGPERAGPVERNATDAAQGESRVVTHALNLATLKLAPGSQLSIRASASDYQPVTTLSHPRRLTVLRSEELKDRLAERQRSILNDLTRLLKLEQESRKQVTGLEIQLDQVGHLKKEDVDHLQQAELTQRQVDRGLSGEKESVPKQIDNLLDELKNNKIDDADIERRMQGLQEEIARLAKGPLPTVAREMTSALKSLQAAEPEGRAPAEKQPPRASPEATASLKTAGQGQDDVIQSLEQMLAEMAEWDNYRRFQHDIAQLRRDQENLAKDTKELGNRTLSKDLKDLDQQQAADLKKLGQQQLEMARHFDKVQQRMDEMADKLRETDPLAADAVADALHQARQQAVAGQMREAGRNVEQNQVGQAAARQQQVMKELDELLDILANRRERELGRLVKKLREAEEQLAQLRQQQEGLRKRMKEAAEKKDEAERRRELERLTREQKQLQQEAERFARMLKRLQAEDASRSAAKGGAKMGQAGQQGEQGDAQGAAEQAEGAKKDLDDAQRQLAQARRKAEMDLATEQMARLEDNLRALKQQQERLLTETKHYDELKKAHGRLTRAEAISVGDLARQQTALDEETQAAAKKLSTSAVFEQALKNAARDMAAAARLLGERETSEPTQQAEAHALARLEQLLVALKPPTKKPGQKQDGGQGGQGGQQGQGGGIPSTAELTLLKLMQQEVNDRTRAIETLLQKTKELSPEQLEDYSALGEEQGRLADLLLELTKPDKEGEDGGKGLDEK